MLDELTTALVLSIIPNKITVIIIVQLVVSARVARPLFLLYSGAEYKRKSGLAIQDYSVS